MPDDGEAYARITISNDNGVQAKLVPWSIWQAHLAFDQDKGANNTTITDSEASVGVPGNESLDASAPPVEPTTVSTINRDNADAIVAKVFGIYVGDTYRLPHIGQFGTEPVVTRLIRNDHLQRTFVLQEFDCSNGGYARRFLNITSSTGEVQYIQTEYADCLSSDLRFDGVVESRVDLGASRASAELSIIDIDGRRSRFSGWTKDKATFSTRDQYRMWRTRNLAWEREPAIDGSGGDLSLSRVNTAFAEGTWEDPRIYHAQLGGGFQVRADWSGGELITVRTLDEFRFDSTLQPDGISDKLRHGWFFTRGRLELVAEDGSLLELDADTGEPDAVRISLTDHAGTDDTTCETG